MDHRSKYPRVSSMADYKSESRTQLLFSQNKQYKEMNALKKMTVLLAAAGFAIASPVPGDSEVGNSGDTWQIVDNFQITMYPTEFRVSLAAGPTNSGDRFKGKLLPEENGIRQEVEDTIRRRCDNDWDDSYGDDGVRVCKNDDKNTDMLFSDLNALPYLKLELFSQSQLEGDKNIYRSGFFRIVNVTKH